MDIRELEEQAINKSLKEEEKLIIQYFQSVAQKRSKLKRHYKDEMDKLESIEAKLYKEDFYFGKQEGMCNLDLIFNNK